MNQKGIMEVDRIMFIIAQIVAIILFGYVVMNIAVSFAESDTTLKINIAEDVFMMVNTLVGISGDAVVKVPYNTSKFYLIMDNQGISVFKVEEPEPKWISRKFFVPKGFKIEGSAKNWDQICMVKEKKKIYFKKC